MLQFAQSANEIANALKAAAEQRFVEGDEELALRELCRALNDDLLPFIGQCVDAVFGNATTRRARRLVDWSAARRTLSALYWMRLPVGGADVALATTSPTTTATAATTTTTTTTTSTTTTTQDQTKQ